MNPDRSPQSLCLVRLSALGDVVLVLPLVRLLRRRWPEAKITWIVGKGVFPALAGLAAEGIEFVVIDKPRGLGDYLALRRRFSGRTFDALLCLQASWRANWIYPCLRARRKIGFGADRAKDFHRFFVGEGLPPARPHLADGFLQFAEALGLPFPSEIEWGLPVAPEAAAWADGVLPKGSFAALSPCASKPERDWPVDRYAAVVRALRERGLPVVLLGGPSPREREVADAILRASGDASVLDLVGKTRIPQLVAALARCRLLIAPDTGAVHIATACGRPVVGLYAVAPASRTGPYRKTEFCVDRFEEAVRTFQGREPAQTAWAHRVHDPRAMSLIATEDVIARIDLILRESAS
jgi:heptosyltransferase I